jgi:electron transfer flavoprotein alpha subunit
MSEPHNNAHTKAAGAMCGTGVRSENRFSSPYAPPCTNASTKSADEQTMNTTMEALTIGANADALSSVAAQYGATVVHQAHHDALTDFGPEAWGEAAAQVITSLSPLCTLQLER